MEVATALLAASRRLSMDKKEGGSGQSWSSSGNETRWNSGGVGGGLNSFSSEVVRYY